ncbi:hypothetical protein B0H14DRAFT_2570215 [Mycena olivaceomarginata]|nr:hypothetical protein B0H14DRAFT_2570215 [Mycena olivaceomarginata]
MPAGRPPLDPDTRQARRQESRRRYEANATGTEILIETWQHVGSGHKFAWQSKSICQCTPRPSHSFLSGTALRSQKWLRKRGDGTARGLRRTPHAIETGAQREAELRAYEHQETVRRKKKALATNDVRQAHGLPNIAVARGRRHFPPQDLSSHRRAALPRAGSDSDDGTSSDGAASSRRRTRAATPPIYEGGTTARTRTVAPRVCPECECEGCPGCICMCPASTGWIEHADGEGHFFPTCIWCGGEDCPGCSCICPKSTQLKEHGGHFEG